MTFDPKCVLAAGLLSLVLASGCTPVQPVALPFYASTTPSIPAQTARPRYVYCVTAPPGYVVPQDKWDPYLVPCPVRAVPVVAPSEDMPEGPDTDDDPGRPTPPPSPPPEPSQASHEGVKAGEAAAEVTRNPDGTTTETSIAGGANATYTR